MVEGRIVKAPVKVERRWYWKFHGKVEDYKIIPDLSELKYFIIGRSDHDPGYDGLAYFKKISTLKEASRIIPGVILTPLSDTVIRSVECCITHGEYYEYGRLPLKWRLRPTVGSLSNFEVSLVLDSRAKRRVNIREYNDRTKKLKHENV